MTSGENGKPFAMDSTDCDDLGIAATAKCIGLSVRSVRDLCYRGELRFTRRGRGGAYRFRREWIDEYLVARTVIEEIVIRRRLEDLDDPSKAAKIVSSCRSCKLWQEGHSWRDIAIDFLGASFSSEKSEQQKQIDQITRRIKRFASTYGIRLEKKRAGRKPAKHGQSSNMP